MSVLRLKLHGSILTLCACLVLLLITSACTPPPDTRAADEAAIRDADAQWSKTAGAGDLDGTVAYYTEDASVLAPNAPIASDKQSIRGAWASLLGSGASISWQATKVEVARSGDLAYIQGTYKLTSKQDEQVNLVDRGKFVEVWKKQADGKWKVVTDIFNSDHAGGAVARGMEEVGVRICQCDTARTAEGFALRGERADPSVRS
jgi:ketosteroid isomerase-like protein